MNQATGLRVDLRNARAKTILQVVQKGEPCDGFS